jgi:hypothetical protein
VQGKLKPGQREMVTDWFKLVQKALTADVGDEEE